jgi:ribosomal-protein-alanine N-acetyltransferase
MFAGYSMEAVMLSFETEQSEHKLASLAIAELNEYCGGGIAEVDRHKALPPGVTGLVVFDRAAMHPRVFACSDAGDAILLEAVLAGHPAIAYVGTIESGSQTARDLRPRGGVAVTRMTRADLDAIVAIDKENWAGWANTLPFYRQLLDIVPSAVVAARDTRGDVIGFAVGLVCENRSEGWVLSVDVKQSHRGLGIGRELVKGLLQNLRDKGCTSATAIIAPGNLGSVGLFEGFGFVATKVEENYFGFGDTQIRYHGAT